MSGKVVARCWVLVAPAEPGGVGVQGARFYVNAGGYGTTTATEALEFKSLADARAHHANFSADTPYRVYRRGRRERAQGARGGV